MKKLLNCCVETTRKTNHWHGSSRELVEQIDTESSSSPTSGSLNPDSGDSASSSSVVARTGAEIIIPDDRRHSGRVALEVPGEEVVVVVIGVDAFLLKTLKNPFILQLCAAGHAATEAVWDPEGRDPDDDSVLAKNGFSTTMDEEEEDSKDENSKEGSDDVEEEEDVEAPAFESDVYISLEVGATGAIGEVKHGLVKLRTGVEGAIASGASKLNLESSVDGDGSSTTDVPSLEGSPRAFGLWGRLKSIDMFLFPFTLTVADVLSGSLDADGDADGDERDVG